MTGFWKDRRVLVTGHTGFKGSWLALWLHGLGARVTGLALAPDTEPALFDQLGLAALVDHHVIDIRDQAATRDAIRAAEPEVIFHLAAQPLVRRSYDMPVETWATNVMGTAHVLDALKGWTSPLAVVAVTTDKVYENREWHHAYRETDRLGGHDPYSASKAACELVIASYRKSFFAGGPVRIASARAGNVIGGGDWARDRIVPDLARAFAKGETLHLRNPSATRPWQHVLDPLNGYMALGQALLTDGAGAEDSFNFGPDASGERSVRELADTCLRHWPGQWQDASDPKAVHEAGRLSLATAKAKAILGWSPRWDFEDAVRHTIAWYRAVHEGASPVTITAQQLRDFEGAAA